MKQREKITEGLIKKDLEPLFQQEDLKLVILFGSISTGNIHKRSDIDLGFLFVNIIDILNLTNSVIRLLKTDTVDVVDLRRASPLLKFAAVKNGKLLYEKAPGMFHEFASLAFRRYVDTKKLRDARAESIKIFLKKNNP
ncbi:MAG: nucleotidyltransferase domain-containing protein [Candidatus Brocadiaceae bacterium]|nr:nucleotidyltransferase domain-containing protein [Candidatus Brocadiaceae bacterium]